MTDMTMSFHDRSARSHRVVTPQRRKVPAGLIAGLKRRLRVRPWSTTAYGAFLVVGAAALVNAAFLQNPAQPRRFLGQPEAPVAAQPPVPPSRPIELARSDAPQPVVRPANPGANPGANAGAATGAGLAGPPSAVAALPRQPVASPAVQPAAQRESTVRDPIGELIRTGQVPAQSMQSGDPVTRGEVPRPPAAVPDRTASLPAESRITAVQRALNRAGVGPVKTDGRLGEETRAAIERFERERRLPVTRELSPRTLRELAAVSGSRID